MADEQIPTTRVASRVGLRGRLVLVGGLGVGLVLLVGGLLLVGSFRGVLLDTALEAGQLRASDLATLAEQGTLPPVLAISGEEEALVQVVVADRVVASSSNIAGEEPLAVTMPDPGDVRIAGEVSLPVGDEGEIRLVSRGVLTPDGPGVVHVAVAVGAVDDAVEAAIQTGTIGVPVLVVVLVGVMWVLVGRALAPIEAIRREAEEIEGDRLDRRVPEPTSDDEVGRLARTVNGMLGRLEESAQRQQRFVGDAAHELRSPVASLRAQLETVRTTTRAVEWDHVTTDLLDETLRMQRLIEQLLLLARIDGIGLPTATTAVDLDDVVRRAAGEIRARTEVDVDVREVAPVQVRGQATLLDQVVRNLLDNAARHATQQVHVRLRAVGQQAVLSVHDDGPGIPAERRSEVFDRFARLDDARDRDAGGAGLGLAIVADIVRAHAGTVEIGTADQLGGAAVVVRLPLPQT